ncbi:MAG: hypothetical protein QGI45_15590, partial [Myxococcota bacterium]|nr:hypothetical protein [Myxococcota bacterium]
MPSFVKKSLRSKVFWPLALCFCGLAGLLLFGTPGDVSTPSAPEPEQLSQDYTHHVHVDEFSGDFSLSLPLLQIPGRNGMNWDIGLQYKAGIALEQQASEVGLGWSLSTPSFSRVVNGVPDDQIAEAGSNNYSFYRNMPAVYPMGQFLNQKLALDSARKQANRQLLMNVAIGLAITAATGGAGAALAGSAIAAGAATAVQGALLSTALSTGTQMAQSSSQFQGSAEELALSQRALKAMLDESTVNSAEMAIAGKIYCQGCGDYDAIGGEGTQALDYRQGDSYILSAPSYAGELRILDNGDDADEQVFWPMSYSANGPSFPDSGDTSYTKCALADVTEYCGANPDIAPTACSGRKVVCTENTFAVLLNTYAATPSVGLLLVASNGHRYLFNTPIERYVQRNLEGFVPEELVPALPGEDWTTFSWVDHYPGGLNDSNYNQATDSYDSGLKAQTGCDAYETQSSCEDAHCAWSVGDGQCSAGRYGAAEVLWNGYVGSWGLTRIEDGNRALQSEDIGNAVDFSYADLSAVPVDASTTSNCYGSDSGSDDRDYLTVSNSSRSLVESAYYGVDTDYTMMTTGHKSITRSYQQRSVLSAVRTGTHVAKYFYSCAERYDGKEAFAKDRLGGMPKLDRIVLWSLDGDGALAQVVKKVEFTYDHSLASGAPDNSLVASGGCGGSDCGRLTLLSVEEFNCGASVSCGTDAGDTDGWASVKDTVFSYAEDDTPGDTAVVDTLCEQIDQVDALDIRCEDGDISTHPCVHVDQTTCESDTTNSCWWDGGECHDPFYCAGSVSSAGSCQSVSDCCDVARWDAYWDASSESCMHAYFDGDDYNRLGNCLYPGVESWYAGVSADEKNPPYIRDAQDRWGYFHFSESTTDF